MNNKGQSVLAEHVMIFFVVIAAIVAMTTFVQRGFEARIHDVRNYAFNSIRNSGVCDVNCVAAAGNVIADEYEPYYAQTISDVQQKEADRQGETQGNAQVLGAIYYKSGNESTQAISTSAQLPPCADTTKGMAGCYNASN